MRGKLNLIPVMVMAYMSAECVHAALPKEESFQQSRVQAGGSCLNFRARATTRSQIHSCVSSRSAVQVLEYNPGGFSRVVVDGRSGYMFTRYLSPPRVTAGTGPVIDVPDVVVPPPVAGGPLSAGVAHVQWGAERQSWTTAALSALRANWSKLGAARDIDRFCPGYTRASRAEQENCWLLIVGALVRRESNFRPTTVYGEGAPLYYNSVGLLQLSHNSRARECTPEGARSENDLKNPELNLRCGIRILARLVGSRGQIAGRAGAGAYWSVLRNPGEHRSAKANGIASEASNLFRTRVAGRLPDRAVAAAEARNEPAALR